MGAKMHELVKVGYDKLAGKIIKLDGETALIQFYKETIGFKIKDPINRTK